MATVKTPARALLPGDIVRDPFQGAQGHLLDRAVVLAVAFADPGPVGLQLGRLGPIPKHLDRVATVSWHPEHHVEVEREPDGFRRQVALGLLQDVERLAAGGHVAHVRLVHDEIQVSSADVHVSVARALEETRVRAWHAMVEERGELAERLCAALLEHDAGGVTLNTWGDIRRTVAKFEAGRVPAAPVTEPYSVQPTRCACHPETCACKPWTLKQGGATVTTFQNRDAAIETARRLNAS